MNPLTDEQRDARHREGSFGLGILRGIGSSGQHVYGQTADDAQVVRRRRRNKAARAARRVTRRRS